MAISKPSSQQSSDAQAVVVKGEDRAVISRGVKILGDISGQEDLLVYGVVEGNIEFRENNVIIGEKGTAHADITAKVIIVEGEVKGELRGSEQITIKPSGDVTGDIKAPRVILNDGCKFKGMIDMENKAHPQGELKKTQTTTKTTPLPSRSLGNISAKTSTSHRKS